MEIQQEDKMVGGDDKAIGDGLRILTYYEKEGRGVEDILRCSNCKKLVLRADVGTVSGCPNCGTRKFNDVKALSNWEMFKIWVGYIDFPDRQKFLKEFDRG